MADGDGTSSVDRPWYQRGRSALLALGALAAALIAILTLWERVFPADAEDFVAITSAEVSRQVTLADFAKTQPRIDVDLTPAPAAAPAAPAAPAALVADETRESADPVEPPSDEPTETEPPAETDDPANTEGPAETEGPTETGEPTGTATPTTRFGFRDKMTAPDLGYLAKVADQRVLDEYELPDPRKVPAILPGIVDTVDPEGKQISPEESAERIAAALASVETELVQTGSNGESRPKKAPLGWGVVVNVESNGLKSVPLLLRWSLDGLDVPVSWRVDTIAYRLTSTTDHDAGSVEVWVPKLAEPGAYNVNFTLERESDGVVLARSRPAPIPVRSP